MTMSSNTKKLPFSLQSKPFGLINKKINNNSINNNINNSNSSNNSNLQYIMNHNLPKYSQKKNNENISLLDKIKDKIIKEKKESQNLKEKEKDKKDNISINNDKTLKIIEPNEAHNNKANKVNDMKKDEDINEILVKNENIDDEDDILSEEVDEMEEGGNNVINSINKINCMNVHSNFIKTHYYSGSGFSMNSNNSNSNNSSIKQKCCTEPDEFPIFPKSYQNEPSSGRSNYSGNSNIAQPGPQVLGTDNNSNYFGLYGQYAGYGYQIKNSFLSTGANTNNSHNLSGHKIDSSLSNESGQSPHYLGKYQRLQYNNSMTNIAKNNTFIFPFTSSITPIDNRHIYTSSFNSNESLFRQPFSLNTKTFTNNFNYSKKEKQVIKLEDVALGKETRTTVMIRNIPSKYTDRVLEKELEQFEGKYDCLYMPFDYENGGNKGYAFLNLKSPYHVLLFYEVFNNKCWMFFDSKKICELNYANFQGIDEIKKHAKNYKGSKKPNFYINTKTDISNNNKLEIPYKYLNLLLQANPNMKYVENKQKNLIVVESFN